MPREIKNISESVHNRLLYISKNTGDDFQYLLSKYALERLLYRLSKSGHCNSFILKGALLFSLWADVPYRSTTDLDLLGRRIDLKVHLKDIFEDICNLDVEDDGMYYNSISIDIADIRENQEYGGQRIKIKASLGKARIDIQIDIGFGDIVLPDAELIEYSSLLNFNPPIIRVYSKESVVAEKVHAIVILGLTNSRLKDFADIHYLAQHFEFDGQRLCKAIKATFERRQTSIPNQVPLALTDIFYNNDAKLMQWNAFLRKSKVNIDSGIKEVCLMIIEFVMPVMDAISNNDPFQKKWNSKDYWK